jgi:hypothetical protein
MTSKGHELEKAITLCDYSIDVLTYFYVDFLDGLLS